MAGIIKRKKALSVNPLKSSQTVGASLAFLGLHRAIPMMHGSQGCTAFGKVFFVRHFREPIPLQTTAMDQVSSVMGADDNIVEGLKTICEKSKPALIGLPTTGLAETQGADIRGATKTFRDKYPEYEHIKVIPVNTPDFSGCFETGYAAAVFETINILVPDAKDAGTKPGKRMRQVNILVSSALTPGDLEVLKDIVEAFGLRPVMIPDLSDSLDGHLTDDDFSPVTIGGTPITEFETLGDAIASLVIGPSMKKSGDLLNEKTGVTQYYFDHLMGLEAVDKLVMVLVDISGQEVPAKLERHRAQLQDAMLDTHFMIGQAKVGIAGDPDLLFAFSEFMLSMGAEIVAAVSPTNASIFKLSQIKEIKIGDLEDLELMAKASAAEILIGNSHLAESANRIGIPLMRVGFPQFDLLGGYQRSWIGYQASRQAVFDFANILMANNHHHEVKPYRSFLAQKPEYLIEGDEDGTAKTHAHSR